jgi:2,4-dienoyl-CoA reductase-like NADH-dependent reductase (Old Yellow Enzyme family)
MSLLFSRLQLRSVTLKNRLVVSPMCQYSSVDGFSNDWHLVHLGSRAVGGAGLIITEAAAVAPEGRISPQDLGIWKDEHTAGLKRITDFIRAQGSVAGIQLAHAGRKASTPPAWEKSRVLGLEEGGWETVAPSPIAYRSGDPLPHELNAEEIAGVVSDFREATRRSLQAGFQVIEIHAAHGYLLNQFLSPLSNQRTDTYGGSFENRMRLLLEVIAAIREVWPADLPLLVRISATDWAEGGWTDDDSVALARVLLTKEVDLIDCSTGANVSGVRIPVKPLYQVPFAERIRKETGMKTGAVGLITTASEAEGILQAEQADLIFMARQELRDPYFPLHAAKELGDPVPWPVQYERAG